MQVTKTTETRQDFNATVGDISFTGSIFEGVAQLGAASPTAPGVHIHVPVELLQPLAEFILAVVANADGIPIAELPTT